MNKILIGFISLVIIIGLSGCATKISSYQVNELKTYESKGLDVKEKNPMAGAALGLLPGFGSFYVEEYGVGIVNLLLWPLSIVWDPVSGYDGSVSINYFATKASVARLQRKDMLVIDREHEDGTIDERTYILKKRKIEDKYSAI